jgi:hypothetical protein
VGIVRMGPPPELVLALRNEYSIKTFVETGTFLGGTSTWAASHFERVTTIENSRAIYERTVAAHGHIPNIEFLFGNSRDILAQVVPALQSPALFWLDGHWCGGESYGEQDECPLIDELEIVNRSSCDHFVMIDDARLFMSPPPLPHRIEVWPSIANIINTIQTKSPHTYIVIFEDVIIAVPQHAQEFLARWCQEALKKNSQVSSLKTGIQHIKKGLYLVATSASGRTLRSKSVKQ